MTKQQQSRLDNKVRPGFFKMTVKQTNHWKISKNKDRKHK